MGNKDTQAQSTVKAFNELKEKYDKLARSLFSINNYVENYDLSLEANLDLIRFEARNALTKVGELNF